VQSPCIAAQAGRHRGSSIKTNIATRLASGVPASLAPLSTARAHVFRHTIVRRTSPLQSRHMDADAQAPNPATVVATRPRAGLGQFWSNPRDQREVWAQPVEQTWARLVPFFDNDPNALQIWSAQRWDGSNGLVPPVDIAADDRALGLATGIRSIPERVRDLLSASVVPPGQLARDGSVQAVTSGIQKEVKDEDPRKILASMRLADTWAVASAGHQLGEFAQNLAAMVYFIHLLLIRTPEYL